MFLTFLSLLNFGSGLDVNKYRHIANTEPLAVMPMRPSLFIIVTLFFFSCGTNKQPDIIYKKGDLWISNFVNNNYPSKAYKDDKIYCSSLLVGYDTLNRFYCLNLKSGKVDWAVSVKNWASQPPIICDTFIYYCSYVGDIYKFGKDGKQLWYLAFPTTYGGHFLNPNNENLIVSTVVYGLREIDCKTGQVINTIGHGKMNVPFPVFRHDTIYQAINDTLFCALSSNHSFIWKNKTGDNIDRVFENNGKLYYFDNTEHLYCLNSKTGDLIWKSDSTFPQPLTPHIEFEGDKIVCYFTDLNKMFLINDKNGKVEKAATYKELQKLNPHCSYPGEKPCEYWISKFLSAGLCTTDFLFRKG